MDRLMIHNIRKEFLNHDLAQYQLTFDDGLYSQYYYSPLFESNQSPRIYFIATGLIQPGKARKIFDGQYLPPIKSEMYMFEAFVKKKIDQFMTLEELEIIADQKEVIIGAHSHFHDIILTEHPLKKKTESMEARTIALPIAKQRWDALKPTFKIGLPGIFLLGRKSGKTSKNRMAGLY